MGRIASLLIGGVAYSLGGYVMPFVFINTILLIVFIALNAKFPSDIKFSEDTKSPLKIRDFITNVKVINLITLIFMTATGLAILDPTIANFLSDYYFLNQIQIIYVFIIMSIFYIIPLIFFLKQPKFLKNIKNSLYIIMGFAMTCFGYMLVGPDNLLFDKSLDLACMGQAIINFGSAFIFIPIIPELIMLGEEIVPDQNMLICDMASGLYSAVYYMGNAVGPLYSGMVGYIGFIKTVRYYNFTQIFYLPIFIYLSGVTAKYLIKINKFLRF